MNSEVFNIDCMIGMKDYPDNYFDLAVVDPPYGIGIDGNDEQRWPNGSIKRKKHEVKGWDSEKPNQIYFNELQRVSENQIIWGGNYFTKYLEPTKAWIFWYKGQQELTMSDGELAWTSFKRVTRMIDIHRTYIWRDNPIHPTQKPIKLYEWIFKNYAEEGQKILDTHLGSGSSRIAAYNYGMDFTGYEIDKDYFEDAEKRFQNHIAQLKIFA